MIFLLAGLLLLLLLVAISFIMFSTNKQTLKKLDFIFITLFISLFTVILYFYSGDKTALKLWLTQDKNHYELQSTINKLGGIDGIIASIQKKLMNNPNEIQGWLILGKLYYAKHDYQAAKIIFQTAYKLDPTNLEIKRYYALLISQSGNKLRGAVILQE